MSKKKIDLISLERKGLDEYREFKFYFKVFTTQEYEGHVHIHNQVKDFGCTCAWGTWEKSRSLPKNKPCKHVQMIIDLLHFVGYLEE